MTPITITFACLGLLTVIVIARLTRPRTSGLHDGAVVENGEYRLSTIVCGVVTGIGLVLAALGMYLTISALRTSAPIWDILLRAGFALGFLAAAAGCIYSYMTCRVLVQDGELIVQSGRKRKVMHLSSIMRVDVPHYSFISVHRHDAPPFQIPTYLSGISRLMLTLRTWEARNRSNRDRSEYQQ